MPNPCPTVSANLLKALRFVPIAVAFSDALSTMVNLHLNKQPLSIVGVSAPFAFFASLGLENRFWLGGIDEIRYVVRHNELPIDEQGEYVWFPVQDTKSARRKLIAAQLIGGAVGLYVAFSDSVQSYYFNTQILPVLNITPSYAGMIAVTTTAIVIAAATGLGAQLNEGLETYKWGRELISNEKRVYSSTASKWVSLGTSSVLGAANCLVDSYNGTTLIATLNIPKSNLFARYMLFGLSSINGIGDYASRGRYLKDCLDEFMGAAPRYLQLVRGSLTHKLYKLAGQDTATIQHLPDSCSNEEIKTMVSFSFALAASTFFSCYITWVLSNANFASSLDSVGFGVNNNTHTNNTSNNPAYSFNSTVNNTGIDQSPNNGISALITTTSVLVTLFALLVYTATYMRTFTVVVDQAANLLAKLRTAIENAQMNRNEKTTPLRKLGLYKLEAGSESRHLLSASASESEDENNELEPAHPDVNINSI